MTGWTIFGIAFGVAFAFCALVFGIVMLWPHRIPKGRSVDEITQRVLSERDRKPVPTRPDPTNTSRYARRPSTRATPWAEAIFIDEC